MHANALTSTTAGRRFRVVLEQAEDGWLVYPEAIQEVVALGDSAAEALADLVSTIRFHCDTFGPSDMPTSPSEP
jgi:predicted RNase H-like HicB family nuclease